ncbi:MAG: response regulator, partial [Verrucomicrobiales bacterium]|nr:response regulator [Verrucomicrobiales bacterium]
MIAKKILVVDDERIVAEDIMECLRGIGCEVCGTAKSGVEAIEKAELHRPDLVLMDIVLQGQMDGVEAATVIREEWGIPAVFLSAYSDPGVLDRAKKIGPLGYVVKPFDEAGLRTTVEVALHRLSMDAMVKESGDWFATTLESIGDGVVATDVEGRVSFVNRAAERLTGHSAGELTGEMVEAAVELFDEQNYSRFEGVVAEALDSGKAVELKSAVLVGASGKNVPVDVSASPIRDSDGDLVGAVLVLRDATEKRQTEAEAKMQREKLESLVNARTGEILRANKRLLGEVEERKRAEMALNYRMGMQKLVSSVMSRF